MIVLIFSLNFRSWMDIYRGEQLLLFSMEDTKSNRHKADMHDA